MSTWRRLSMALAFSCITFLTTIWGEGIVFTWLLNITGISALLVWTSIGFISLRFRQAYIARGLSLLDLPYRQPLYPLLPLGVICFGTLMFIAQGYAAVRQAPFEAKVCQHHEGCKNIPYSVCFSFLECCGHLHWSRGLCRSLRWIFFAREIM